MAAQKSDAMESAIVTLRELTADEKIRLQCEARERYQLDLKSWQTALQTEEAARIKAESRAMELEKKNQDIEIQKQHLEVQNEGLRTERQAFYEFALRNPGLTLEEALNKFLK